VLHIWPINEGLLWTAFIPSEQDKHNTPKVTLFLVGTDNVI